jgi:hypothetical protein
LSSRRRLFSVKLRPATFAEAGVAAPFTTPTVAQARLRLDRRGRVEIVARNPTGNGGAYIMPLKAATELFRLSIHDRVLVDRLLALPAISPLSIRAQAQAVALEGLAGPDAKDAASRAIAEAEEHALLTLLLLLERWLAEAGQPRIDWRAIDTGDRAVRERLKPYFVRLEPSTGMTGRALVDAVESLSSVVAPIGFAQAPFESLAVTTLAELRALDASIGSWAATEHHELAGIAGLVQDCAALTITCAEASLAKAAGLLQTTGRLLDAHSTAPEAVAAVLTRPIWLLHGWRHLIALWQSVADQPRPAQRDVVVELGELVPLVPLEAEEWQGRSRQKPRSQYELHRHVRLNEDWRTGLAIERQAVLERLQAAAL